MKRTITPKRTVELWVLYTEFRKSQIAYSTLKRDYEKLRRRLEAIKKQFPELRTAIQLRDYLLQNYSAETSRRTLLQLQAMGRWAMESQLIKENPYEGLARQIRRTRPSEMAWASFTAEERDRIIATFDMRRPEKAPWVKFLFWTGARPEEAAALRWEHIAADCSQVLIKEALPVDIKKLQGTKNGKTTRFPCNRRLAALLTEIRPPEVAPTRWVFPSAKGGSFDYKNFQSRIWRPLIVQMVKEGKVAFYLPQYNCRHTFITLALEAGMAVKEISYLCRVTPSVIYDHYADRTRVISIPEF